MGQWITNNIFTVYFITVSVSNEEEKTKINKINWVSGSPPILYKLVLGPISIVHTNFQENPLTTLGIFRHFKIIYLILIGSVGHQQHIFRLFYHRQRFL